MVTLKSREALFILLVLPLCLIVILTFETNSREVVFSWLHLFSSNNNMLVVACLIYTAMIAIPFMPSISMGLLLMASFGSEGIFAAWVCTSIGLNLSFAVGRCIPNIYTPPQVDSRKKIARWLSTIQKTIEEKPGWIKYGAIALLLNLPGNSLIGGGGGIAMLCGTFNCVAWLRFTLTVLVATALIPVLVYLGMVNLDALFPQTSLFAE